jgi:hypothetical protein
VPLAEMQKRQKQFHATAKRKARRPGGEERDNEESKDKNLVSRPFTLFTRDAEIAEKSKKEEKVKRGSRAAGWGRWGAWFGDRLDAGKAFP